MEVSGQIHDPAALPPEKEARYPWNGILDVPQSRSERFRWEKNLFFLPGYKPLIVQSVA
jgi:hypothetical protein